LAVSSTKVSISLQASSLPSIGGEEVSPRILPSIAAGLLILTVLTHKFGHVSAIKGE
jgi:hypothetical protein